jgi:hypothetical protein
MVRTKDSALSKEQLGAMGNKMIKGGVARGDGKGEGGKGGKGKMYREGPKIKTMSLADVKIKGKIVPLEEIVAAKAAAREEQRQKRKEIMVKKKQEAKDAGEETETKPRTKRDTSDVIKYPKGSNCHHCRKNPGKAGPMIDCEEYNCEMKFCRKCLIDKYGLQISDPNEEEKEEESKSLESLDSDDSMIDEDRPIEKPGVMNTGNARWKCPVCEKICICNKCRKDKGLPALSNMSDIRKAIKNKFPNVWTYLIYNRDHPNGSGNNANNEDEADDSDESGETTTNNNNNNNSNNNNDDAMDEDSAEEIFQKPKRKAAAKKEKKSLSPKEKPKKAKKNVIEEEEFIVEEILDKRKRKGIIEYLIKWEGYGEESNTWEVESNLNCPALLKKFEQRDEKSAESEEDSDDE